MKELIYLVDDDDDDRFLAQQSMKKQANCQLKSFENGEELIIFLKGHPQVLPTLILLDLNMPRMNGFETLVRLKANPDWSTIPVIVLTTSNQESDRQRCCQLGASDFLTKPADYNSLVGALASVSQCWEEAYSINWPETPK